MHTHRISCLLLFCVLPNDDLPLWQRPGRLLHWDREWSPCRTFVRERCKEYLLSLVTSLLPARWRSCLHCDLDNRGDCRLPSQAQTHTLRQASFPNHSNPLSLLDWSVHVGSHLPLFLQRSRLLRWFPKRGAIRSSTRVSEQHRRWECTWPKSTDPWGHGHTIPDNGGLLPQVVDFFFMDPDGHTLLLLRLLLLLLHQRPQTYAVVWTIGTFYTRMRTHCNSILEFNRNQISSDFQW